MPVEALLREADHYWELDTFEGKKSDNYVLLVMINRKTRSLIIKKINPNSESMLKAIKQIYGEYNLTINGLITDNCSENALLHTYLIKLIQFIVVDLIVQLIKLLLKMLIV